MSLVAYDSSDDSEEDKTSKKISGSEKKTKEGVKIRIPSLKQFEEEEEEETPVAKKSKFQSGSGLFSLLPPPKNAILSKPGFVPYIFSKKEQSSVASKNKKITNTKIISAPSVVSENQESDIKILSPIDKSSEETVNTSANDFFWLDDLASSENKKQENENNFSTSTNSNSFLQKFSSQLPPTLSSSHSQLYPNESNAVSYFHQYQKSTETNAFETEQDPEQSVEQSFSLANDSTESVTQLDEKESLLKNKEFLKFKGRKRGFENIDIIDVNADDQLTDKNEWLMKNLTEESMQRPSKKKHNMPTQQQKRKHQITYLAFQAKERENDLKNQWALNSRTRRETQAKYGF